MKKYFIALIASALLMGSFTSCHIDIDDDDCIEDVLEGKFHDSYWSTRGDSDDVPYYTMKFSGMNTCRLRHYITADIDIDVKAYYYVDDYDHGTCYYVISKNNHEYAYFRIVDRHTILLEIDGHTYYMYKQ